MENKKGKKNKVKIGKKNISNKIESNKSKENYELIKTDDFIIKNIVPDRNCFYRVLSYFYRENQEEFNEFRKLITEYLENHSEQYLEFIAEEELNIPTEKLMTFHL